MPNLGLIVLPLMLVLSGSGWSQSTLAAQSQPDLVDALANFNGDTSAIHSRWLVAKKCTLKRYRRPR